MSSPQPRIFVIGAGSRGSAYARAITQHTNGQIVGIAEPVEWKRLDFSKRYNIPADGGLVLSSWSELLASRELVEKQVDGICICTLDETHTEIILGLRPLNLHTLCEKPLATNLTDVRAIRSSLLTGPPAIFAIGHVLRYSPHNRLLYSLLPTIGDIININHTEPVGFWHFAHSYVRGNWRSAQKTAPSLLTKCCHDVDLLLWFLSYPRTGVREHAHAPARVSSHGQLVHFRRRHKPELAGEATNCFSCPAEPVCIYSAKKIYIERNLHRHNLNWPIKIVVPEIEDAPNMAAAEEMLTSALKVDYEKEDPDVARYGRCVYEAVNDVVDNQTVVLEFDDGVEPGHTAKTATLTMIAHSEAICERFTKIYGTLGEITADSQTVTRVDFRTGKREVFSPEMYADSNHGGGDQGLAMAFVGAIERVMKGEEVDKVQREVVGVTVEEAVRSHEVVFWAEEARVGRKVVEWEQCIMENQN